MAIQNKRVHFAESPFLNTIKVIEPDAQSPTWSDSSLPDSDSSGPSTPPSVSSLASRPLPFSLDDEPKVPVCSHPILFDARTNSSPLVWDVSLPTHYATLSRPGKKGKGRELSHLHPMDLAMPATSPPLTSMDIHIPQLPPLWKPIQLRHQSGSRATPITLGEVLEATHYHLQTRMSEREFNMAPEEMRRKIQKSVHRRLDAARRTGDRALVSALEHAGILRVDALGGANDFAAFVPTPPNAPGDSWTVIFRPAAQPQQ